jgi:hypothetical protein
MRRDIIMLGRSAVLYMAWSGQVQRTFVSSMAAKLADKCVELVKK